MNQEDNTARAYMLVLLHPGKEKEFSEEILSKGLLVDSKVERMDFVHGIYDYVIVLIGDVKDIDRRIIEIRKSPFIARTETLL